MKKEIFLVLILIIGGVGMILWTFFGGNDKNQTIINGNTGFVEKLINSGGITNSGTEIENITTGNINTPKNSSKEYQTIILMMPKYFYTAGWKDFAQDLYKNQKIYIKFELINNLQEYYNNIANSEFSGADIVLIPYDWNTNFNAKSFSFQQNLESAFDSFVSPIITNSPIKFLPFSADPMITYSASGLLNQISFINISDLVYDWIPTKAKSFPLFFGIISEDFDDGFWREYQDILRYALMHYFSTYNDSSSLSTWIDSNVLQKYNKKNLNEILNLIIQTTPDCKLYPSICFQIYNFVGVRFGFLSDIDIVQQFFPKKYSTFSNLEKNKMPFFGLESPVRIRGWSISNSIQNIDTINAVYLFLGEYMNNHDNYNLRNSTLPVFSNPNKKLWENEFIGPRGYILESGGNYIQSLRNKKDFWNMIEYKISTKDYFQ